MGLDQYLIATKGNRKEINTAVTGACGGLFPLAPNFGDREQIGYWRKFYDLDTYIVNMLDVDYEDINCQDLRLTLEDVDQILLYATEEYKEYLGLIRSGQNDDETKYYCQIWKQTVETFATASKLIVENESTIYYHIWY